MSISAVLHSRPPLRRFPETIEDARSDFATFFGKDRMESFNKHGKTGAKVFGAALLAAILTAYSPETFAAQQHMPMSSTTIFMQVLEFSQTALPNGLQFANNAAAGAVEFAGAMAVHIQDNIIAPSVGAVRSSGNSVFDWVSTQRETISSLGTGIMDSIKEVTDYLIPKTKGEIVERGILIIAALKSFSEGVSFAVKGLRKIGNKLSGREEPADPAPPAPTEVHHHHYYGDGAKMPDAARPPVAEQTSPPRKDAAANDNDYGSPQA